LSLLLRERFSSIRFGTYTGSNRAPVAEADMQTMIAAGRHLATRSKKRQSARIP
jgi:hypothetical protein